MKLLAAAVGVLIVVGCTNRQTSEPAPVPSMPTDGVHINGAIQGVYPVASGGRCEIATVNDKQVVQFAPNVQAGPVIGMEIVDYRGAASYAKVGWPPYDRSAFWVGVVGGRTWRASSGQIVVESDSGARISGTVSASNMSEVGGTTYASARGSWTCQKIV